MIVCVYVCVCVGGCVCTQYSETEGNERPLMAEQYDMTVHMVVDLFNGNCSKVRLLGGQLFLAWQHSLPITGAFMKHAQQNQ